MQDAISISEKGGDLPTLLFYLLVSFAKGERIFFMLFMMLYALVAASVPFTLFPFAAA
jgi:hypothetical protein